VIFGHNRQVPEQEMVIWNATVIVFMIFVYVGRPEGISKKCLLLL